MAVIFVPDFKINENNTGLNLYYGKNNCSGDNPSIIKPEAIGTNMLSIIIVPGSLVIETCKSAPKLWP